MKVFIIMLPLAYSTLVLGMILHHNHFMFFSYFHHKVLFEHMSCTLQNKFKICLLLCSSPWFFCFMFGHKTRLIFVIIGSCI